MAENAGGGANNGNSSNEESIVKLTREYAGRCSRSCGKKGRRWTNRTRKFCKACANTVGPYLKAGAESALDILSLPATMMARLILSGPLPAEEEFNNGPEIGMPSPVPNVIPPAAAPPPGLRRRARAGSGNNAAPPVGAAGGAGGGAAAVPNSPPPPPPVRPIPVRPQPTAAAGAGGPPGGGVAAAAPPAPAPPPAAAAPAAPAPVNKTDYYKILGVARGATNANIKKEYRKQAIRMHPNRGGNTADFQFLQAAYEFLSEPNRRMIYTYVLEKGQPHAKALEIASIEPLPDLDAIDSELNRVAAAAAAPPRAAAPPPFDPFLFRPAARPAPGGTPAGGGGAAGWQRPPEFDPFFRGFGAGGAGGFGGYRFGGGSRRRSTKRAKRQVRRLRQGRQSRAKRA